MEKRSAHYPLSTVRRLLAEGKRRTTTSAITSAARLGFDLAAIYDVVAGLTHADFYKSMTTYTDHRIWQDVYRPTTSVGQVYLKLTVFDHVLIVSFKEL